MRSSGSRTAGGRSEEEGAPPLVTIVSVECNAYMDWQVATLYHSWRDSGLPGKLVRLVACPEDQRASSSQRFSDLPGLETHFHEVADPAYPPLNRPLGLLQWLEKGGGRDLPADALVFMIDSDMVFYGRDSINKLAPMLERVRSGATEAIGSDFGYPYDGLRANNFTLAERFGISGAEELGRLQPIGVPVLMRKEAMRRFAHPYYEITKKITDSPELSALVHDGREQAPWIREMFGYMFAAAGLHHETQEQWPVLEAPQPPFVTKSSNPLLVHYDHSFHLCGRVFGKALYTELDFLNCSVNASTLALLEPPSRAEVNSSQCDLCVESGDSFGTPPECGLPGRAFGVFAWEQVHGAVSAWRSTRCP